MEFTDVGGRNLLDQYYTAQRFMFGAHGIVLFLDSTQFYAEWSDNVRHTLSDIFEASFITHGESETILNLLGTFLLDDTKRITYMAQNQQVIKEYASKDSPYGDSSVPIAIFCSKQDL